MQITPAILSSDLELFKKLIVDYQFVDSVDIDIIRPPFIENQTLQFNQINDLIDYKKYLIGFHLMVSNPFQDLTEMIIAGLGIYNLKIYLHQESDISFLDNFEWPENWQKCIAVKLESELKSLDYYNQFSEVQLMSIVTGRQGNPFNPSVVDKVGQLKEMGYAGTISLDGGINPQTVQYIKGYSIDRISVGSYFQKSQNAQESFRMLKEALL